MTDENRTTGAEHWVHWCASFLVWLYGFTGGSTGIDAPVNWASRETTVPAGALPVVVELLACDGLVLANSDRRHVSMTDTALWEIELILAGTR